MLCYYIIVVVVIVLICILVEDCSGVNLGVRGGESRNVMVILVPQDVTELIHGRVAQ